METTMKGPQEQGKTAGSGPGTTQSKTSTTPGPAGSSATASAAQPARDQRSEVNRSAEVVEQAKRAVSDVYDRTSRSVQETYGQALEYGRENPGKVMLIAFGAGIGVGLLLAGNFHPRSRRSRIVPPVMNALSEIAAEFFR